MATRALPQPRFAVDMPPRAAIASAVETLLAVLDVLDGDADPDLEQTYLEDDFMEHPANGPGCPVADPDEGCEDGQPRDDGEPGDPEDREEETDKSVDDDGCDDINDDREHEYQGIPGDGAAVLVFANEKASDGTRPYLGRSIAGVFEPADCAGTRPHAAA